MQRYLRFDYRSDASTLRVLFPHLREGRFCLADSWLERLFLHGQVVSRPCSSS